MTYDNTVEEYNKRVSELGPKYDSLIFESVHNSVVDLLPSAPASVLDVGCGSGRDADWFATHGYDVVAVEPAAGMLDYARCTHSHSNIQFIQDKLPGLQKCYKLGLSFDVIIVSAVWMHVAPDERPRAFRKLVGLLQPGGVLVISLRNGPMSEGFLHWPTSSHEIELLAKQHGIAVVRTATNPDNLGRSDVRWETVCLRLPDDGTEALPLLRHTILNDAKSSTYKLALIRCLVRIADGAAGSCVVEDEDGDGYVTVPLGLVALYWLRIYKPLVEASLPQMPLNRDGKSLGFVGDAFRNLKEVSPYDLRIGARFAGDDAEWVHRALVDCRDTIHKMPATYIRYPNSPEKVFKTSCDRIRRASDTVVLNRDYLASFGELRVPAQLWTTLSRFACWIEPSLVSEWVRLMQGYARAHNISVSADKLFQTLTWLDPERDTNEIRSIAHRLFEAGDSIFCVWSGRKLSGSSFAVDHCFPFAAWPCNDMWNLMPTHPSVNSNKSDRLVTSEALEAGRERIFEWWQQAYLEQSPIVQERFTEEALAALPITAGTGKLTDAIFNGLFLKRQALKRNLQLDEWTFGRT